MNHEIDTNNISPEDDPESIWYSNDIVENSDPPQLGEETNDDPLIYQKSRELTNRFQALASETTNRFLPYPERRKAYEELKELKKDFITAGLAIDWNQCIRQNRKKHPGGVKISTLIDVTDLEEYKLD